MPVNRAGLWITLARRLRPTQTPRRFRRFNFLARNGSCRARFGISVCGISKVKCPSSSSTPGCARCRPSSAMARCSSSRPIDSSSTGSRRTSSSRIDELVGVARRRATRPRVRLEVGSRRDELPAPVAAPDARSALFRGQTAANCTPIGSRLNPEFTFASFVEGKSNQLAKAAAVQVAENPGPRLQPAVHLRRRRPRQDASDAGRGSTIKARDPDARVAYVHSRAIRERHGASRFSTTR